MNLPAIIERKRDGEECSAEEIAAIVRGAVDGTAPDYQLSAWLMAVYFRGMSRAETAELTERMMHSGEVLDLSGIPGVKVDKHSTGGVGDKITIPLAPAAAAAGIVVPMISGRGLGHTGGTLDKLESIPGLGTDLDPADFRKIVGELGFAIASAGAALAPADARLYALRDVSGTVPSVPLIVASILSKKYAAGVEALVLDVKVGSGAFMRSENDARELAQALVDVSAALGKRARALITSMDEPLGRTVGNALEVAESIEVLRGGGPADVVELVHALGGEMAVLASVANDAAAGRALIRAKIASGEALDRFRRWVERQGGDARVVDDPERLPRALVVRDVPSSAAGWIAAIDAREVGLAANSLGAGRQRLGDAVDPAVGFTRCAKVGARVERGDALARVHARDDADAAAAGKRYERAVRIQESRPSPATLVRATLAACSA